MQVDFVRVLQGVLIGFNVLLWGLARYTSHSQESKGLALAVRKRLWAYLKAGNSQHV